MRRKPPTRESKAQRRHPRSEATRAQFTRKVELLEGWVDAGGAPDGQDWPLGPVALREWSDATLGIEAWASPNVASPRGRYADLRERFDEAVGELEKLGLGGNGAGLRKRFQKAKARNKIFAAQILTMRCQIRKREAVLARTEQLLQLAIEREAALTSELAKLRPFRPV